MLLLVVAQVDGSPGAVASARAGEWSTAVPVSTAHGSSSTPDPAPPPSTQLAAATNPSEPAVRPPTPSEGVDDGAVDDGVTATELTVVDDLRSRAFSVTVYSPSGPANATFPLVVFAHGFGASAATYATLERQLAASGFVVAAPDFPYTSNASGNSLDRDDVVNQAGDISVLIDRLVDPASTPDSLLGRIATATPVGVIGHSDGGITVAAVAYNASVHDPRIGAAVVLSGAEIMYPGRWFGTSSPPLLAIHGDADELNPYAASQQLYADATGPKMLVTVLGGSHLGPFTTAPSEPAVAALAADFLHAQLQHDAHAGERLDGDANAEDLVLAAWD